MQKEALTQEEAPTQEEEKDVQDKDSSENDSCTNKRQQKDEQSINKNDEHTPKNCIRAENSKRKREHKDANDGKYDKKRGSNLTKKGDERLSVNDQSARGTEEKTDKSVLALSQLSELLPVHEIGSPYSFNEHLNEHFSAPSPRESAPAANDNDISPDAPNNSKKGTVLLSNSQNTNNLPGELGQDAPANPPSEADNDQTFAAGQHERPPRYSQDERKQAEPILMAGHEQPTENEADFQHEELFDIDPDAVLLCKGLDNERKLKRDVIRCPVVLCQSFFETPGGLHLHIDKHLLDDMQALIPQSYFQFYKRIVCLHCRTTLSSSRAKSGMHSNVMQLNEDTNQWLHLTPKEIIERPAIIIPRVPAAARGQFAAVVAMTLQQIVNTNNLQSWMKWLMLVKLILWDPGRGGRKHGKAIGNVIINRIKLWKQDGIQQLWDEFALHSDKVATKAKLREEDNQTLSPSTPVQYNEQTVKALQNKHPAEDPPDDILQSFNVHPTATQLPPLPKHKPVKVEEIQAYIKKLGRTSSGGVDLFTAQHLMDIEPYETESGTLTQWARVVQLIIEGGINPEANDIVYGARLIAIAKPDGSPRPIAIGSIIRRSAGAILMMRHSNEIANVVGPKQVGICTKGGIEIFTHGFKAMLNVIKQANHGAAIKIDFGNAFNSCRRSKLFQLIRSQLPSLFGYIKGCYAMHVPLFLPN
ncbi:hypothetical protein RFI_25032 [Reticulomyxa filosa]|uniref:C2H2-type domain-containing protein n=1 Tax=Reticulomyxa filosa TaxID=46433 RepID=X6MEB0_RETFI|nr:hypothetical protein RFI_25032 [Reticulomyxa filosa]|eukprot:ETO12343.1 hypothetical protein RFI_25032 [Reticulomyxa filosa]